MTTYHSLNGIILVTGIVSGWLRLSDAASPRSVRNSSYYISCARFARTLHCLDEKGDHGGKWEPGGNNEKKKKIKHRHCVNTWQCFRNLKCINVVLDPILALTYSALACVNAVYNLNSLIDQTGSRPSAFFLRKVSSINPSTLARN